MIDFKTKLNHKWETIFALQIENDLSVYLFIFSFFIVSIQNLQHIAGTTINKDASSILLTAAYRNAALVTGSLTAIAILVMSVIFAEPFFWLRPLCMWSAIALSYDSKSMIRLEVLFPIHGLSQDLAVVTFFMLLRMDSFLLALRSFDLR